MAPWCPGYRAKSSAGSGPTIPPGRVLTLISALATITLIAVCTRTKGSAWHLVVAWAALLGLNHRAGHYFVENRPDMTALFFTTAALALMGVGLEKRRGISVAMGTVCLIVGFFFKQTASVFAMVPLVVLASRGRRPNRTELVLAIAPMAAVAGVILYLKAFCPAVYHYMIEVPGAYRVDWPRAVRSVWRLLLQSPLFLILVGEWLAADGGSIRKDPECPGSWRRSRWLSLSAVRHTGSLVGRRTACCRRCWS